MLNHYKKNLTRINIYAFLCGCRFSLPILFFDFKERGFSYSEIGILFSIQAVSGLIAEIPTGTLADKYGSKFSLAASSLGIGLAYLLMATTTNFYSMVFIFIIWGFAKAFHSGADTAFIIDSLKQIKMEHKSSKYLGQKWSSFYSGLALSSLFSPLIISQFSLDWTYYGTTVTTMMATTLILTTKKIKVDHNHHGSIKHVKSFSQYISYLNDGFSYLKGHQVIKYLLILSVIFMLGPQIFFQYTQKVLQSLNIDKINFGFYYTAFTATAAFASIISHKIDERFGQKKMLLLLFFFGTITLCTQPLTFGTTSALIVIFMIQFLTGFSTSLMNHYINEHIDSHNRATLNSFKTFLFGILMFILSPTVGYMADNTTVPRALMVFGIILLLFSLAPIFKILSRVRRV